MTIVLRDYQTEIADSVRAKFKDGSRRVLVTSPTGSGKTTIFSYVASCASAKNNRVMILAHRAELLEQISRTLYEFSVPHAFVAPGFPRDYRQPVQVASVFSVVRRLHRMPKPDLIILDEAHHAVAGSWEKVIDAWSDSRVLGVTATPCRTDGTGLNSVFDSLVLGPTVRDLIDRKSLSEYRIFAPSTIDVSSVHSRAGDYAKNELAAAADKPTITGDAIGHYRKLANGRRAVVFCVSIEHAQHVAEQFKLAGYSAASIDGSMDRATRRQMNKNFSDGRIQVLTSCDLISEGYDLPAIEVAILLRPTQSESLYLQQVGRALRTFPGKTEAIILDHAGNALRHGLPDDDRTWSLEGSKKKSKARDAADVPVKQCPKCFSVVRAQVQRCACGHVWIPQAREVVQVAGELQEVDPSLLRRQKYREQASAKSLDDLIRLGAARGYRNPRAWALHVFQARQRA